MAQISTGSSTAGKANVDAGFNLNVTLPTDDARTGKARMMTENDPGTITGTAYLKSPETSPDFRLRVGVDNVFFDDSFNASAQNTSLWAYTFATLTAAQPGAGTVNFSAVQGTTSAHGAFMRTWQYFPLTNTAPLAVEFMGGQFNAALVANEVWLAGFGLPSAATTRPTDGVWFRLTTAGLEGVLAFNGVETSTGVIYPFGSIVVGEMGKYVIIVGEREVEFWVDDVFLGHIDIPTGNAVPFLGASQPVFLMKYNTGAVANTNTMRVARVGVSLLDVSANRPAPVVASAQGRIANMGQNGGTMGSNAANVNNVAIPTTAALSNTAALAAGVGLGGIVVGTAQATNVASAGDMIFTSFQNPTPTINLTGRNLVITGVRITCINTGAAVATTPTTLIWQLAYGHTNVSLATTETGSFVNNTAHAPRRKVLGAMTAPVGAAVGALYDRTIDTVFSTPVVIRPGEFIATVARFRVGTATASQEVTALVDFDGYWE
jgi:hypothetical protein